jgi:chemotaxis protein MotB
MRRRHIKEDSENRDRWLISYSDFITLLLALFVVLYAISQVNEGKYRVLANSLGSAFRSAPNRSVVTLDMPAPIVNLGATSPDVNGTSDYLAAKKARRLVEAQRRHQEKMENVAQQIASAFDSALDNGNDGRVSVSRSNLGVRVEIDASLLFAPGKAELRGDSAGVLEAMGEVLKNADHAIQVEGHTDDVPISTERFPSNWELSATRASTVVRLLIASGVDAGRLGATGYGETRPLESNESEEGRRRNRRVTVMVLSGQPGRAGTENTADTSDHALDADPGIEDAPTEAGRVSSI